VHEDELPLGCALGEVAQQIRASGTGMPTIASAWDET
jgi:hypothetical protein